MIEGKVMEKEGARRETEIPSFLEEKEEALIPRKSP